MPINYSLPYIPSFDGLTIISLQKIRKNFSSQDTDPEHASFNSKLNNHTYTLTQCESDLIENEPGDVPLEILENKLSTGELAALHWKKMASSMIMGFAGAEDVERRQNVCGICLALSSSRTEREVEAVADNDNDDDALVPVQVPPDMVFFVSCLRLDVANKCVVLDGAILTRTDNETGRLLDGLKRIMELDTAEEAEYRTRINEASSTWVGDDYYEDRMDPSLGPHSPRHRAEHPTTMRIVTL